MILGLLVAVWNFACTSHEGNAMSMESCVHSGRFHRLTIVKNLENVIIGLLKNLENVMTFFGVSA